MISNPTVLILGAGASFPYGFPLGSGLIANIWRIGKNLDSPVCRQLIRIGQDVSDVKFDRHDVFRFVRDLNSSHLNSIDAFLENKDPKYLRIGKLLILQSLILCEDPDAVLMRDYELFQAHTQLDVGRYSRRWYGYLFPKMYCPWEDFDKNNLIIVTFNYDRSLEYFLYYTLKAAYPGKDESEYLKKLAAIKIYHLHGKMGNLPWQGGVVHQYGDLENYSDPISDQKMFALSNEIRVIHEEVEASEDYYQVAEVIRNASAVYMLGFGFHELNLKRLKDGFRTQNKIGREVAATGFGLESAEKADAARLFTQTCECGISIGMGAMDVLGFLRSEVKWVAKN